MNISDSDMTLQRREDGDFPLTVLRKALGFGKNQGWVKLGRSLNYRQYNLEDDWWQRVIGRKSMAWASVRSGSVILSKLLSLSESQLVYLEKR